MAEDDVIINIIAKDLATKVIDKIKNTIGSLTNVIKSPIKSFGDFFEMINKGKMNLLGVGFFFRQLGMEVKGLLNPMENFMGISYQMARLVGGGLMESLMGITARMMEFGLVLLDSMAPALETVMGWITQGIDWFTNLDSGTKNFIGTIIGLTVGLAPIISSLGFFVLGLTSIFNVLGWLVGPIGLIIAGIGLLVAGFVYLWTTSETFRNVITSVFGFVWNYLSVGIGNIITLLINWGKFILNVFTLAWYGIVEITKWVFEKLGLDFNTFSNTISAVWTGLWDGVKNILSNAWNWITSTIMNSYNATVGILNNLLEAYNRVMEKVGGEKLDLLKTMPTNNNSNNNSGNNSSSNNNSTTFTLINKTGLSLTTEENGVSIQ